MALKVTLKPGEQFVVNGAVIKNGERRANFIIQNKVSLLREKDILQEDEATTPVRRIYFAIMLMYLDTEGSGGYYDEFMLRMSEFMGAITDAETRRACLSISSDVLAKDYYKALATCRKLFDFEASRLNYNPYSPAA